MGGTLIVSRAVNLHSHYKKELEVLGFRNVTHTSADKDGLNFIIGETKPWLVLMEAGFYQAATPYMTGELLRTFPKLNIAAVSLYDYPLTLATWFIWHGAKSYVNMWDGYEEFNRGLLVVRDGRQYISPLVQASIDRRGEWPDTRNKITCRQQECLIMLCCGFDPESIGKEMHISRKTVYNHLGILYNTFHARNREEMVSLAWELDLVTKQDIRFYDKKHDVKALPEWAEIKRSEK